MRNIKNEEFNSNGRVPIQGIHYDKELEKTLLGILLFNENSFSEVTNIDKDCFYIPFHKTVFEAISNVFLSGGVGGVTSIANEVYKINNGSIPLSNVYLNITQLLSGTEIFHTHRIHPYCVRLREYKINLDLFKITNSGDDAYYELNPFEKAELIQSKLKEITDIQNTKIWQTGKDLKDEILNKLKGKEYGKTKFKTFIDEIDQINGGFDKQQFVIVAARPSVGKSVYAVQLALNSALEGVKVGFISLEMSTGDVMTRMLSNYSQISYKAIDKGLLFASELKEKVNNYLNDMTELPIYYADNFDLNLNNILIQTRELKEKHGLQLLIIDYLQLIDNSSKKGSKTRENEVAEISRALKKLTKELDCPIIALSQMSRGALQRTGASRYPMLSDLRESGALEQDCDVVIFLHSDFRSGHLVDENGESTQNQLDFIVRKWRNGDSNIQVKKYFDGEHMTITDMPDITNSNFVNDFDNPPF